MRLQPLIDAMPDERRTGKETRGLAHQEQDRERDTASVGPQDAGQPAQHLARVAPAQRLLEGPLPERAAAAPHCARSTVAVASMAAACASTSR
jgi:hypothetical protein